jgi:dTDP-4-dehydrorhamnose reductase
VKILLTGANGFLGHYLTAQLLQKKYQVIATGRGVCRLPFTHLQHFEYSAMDFTDPRQVEDVFNKYQPDIVIHAGAMSKPDDCELEQELARKINVEGTVLLLKNATKYKAVFIYVSTDFVFDGDKGMYSEEDLANPVNYYGKTKLQAETFVKDYSHSWAIARTVLVYGKPLTGRTNILTIVKEKLEKGEEYSVVSDQVRTPTYVEDLASGIVLMIENKATGIFHLSGADILTPYDMACAAADYLGLNLSFLKKVTTTNFSQPARRPLKTGFNIDKAMHELGFVPVSFDIGLQKTFSS